MYASPDSLEESCLESICRNFTRVFDVCYENESSETLVSTCSEDDRVHEQPTILHRKFRFKDPEFYLCNHLSDQLLRKLGNWNLLSDMTLHLFTQRNTHLQNVKIKNASKISSDGLKILCTHKVGQLECIQMKNICIDGIIECLGSWSKQNLTVLNVSKCTFIDASRHFPMASLGQLKNLKYLNVADTEFNQQTLNVVCEDLNLLERLDISGTSVNNLSPLLKFSDQLSWLSAANLKLTTAMASIIIQLHSLRHLDISIYNDPLDILDHAGVFEILENTDSLQDLVSLEISGWKDVTKRLVEPYIQSHSKLKYLGLVLNLLVFEPAFSEHFSNIIIAGTATEDQITVTLRKHYDRPSYIQKAMYHLFQLTNSFKNARPDIFALILPGMELHPSNFGVQMGATACIYNLTRYDFAKDVHPKLLSKAVELTLNAMDKFPGEYQLQKNSLLTLCSDRILQEIHFERFRCARLVLDSLCAFNETNMNRMAVAICSILAAKVSTIETSELGSRPTYMRKLLEMVRCRVDNKSSDVTLKFTLSALWNLTDESSPTCAVFLENGGVSLFLNVLTTFREDNTILTKVLGLLNNIAEVVNLRTSLMLNSLLEELYTLLQNEQIDISYFAAGIFAHLASDGTTYWTVSRYTRDEILEELAKAIMLWSVPATEMVAYRSFKPFFPLLNPTMDYQVQLWAVWAIHHVCTKNPARYCLMLIREDGMQYFKCLLNDLKTQRDVKHLSSEILNLCNSSKF